MRRQGFARSWIPLKPGRGACLASRLQANQASDVTAVCGCHCQSRWRRGQARTCSSSSLSPPSTPALRQRELYISSISVTWSLCTESLSWAQPSAFAYHICTGTKHCPRRAGHSLHTSPLGADRRHRVTTRISHFPSSTCLYRDFEQQFRSTASHLPTWRPLRCRGRLGLSPPWWS